MIKTRIPKNTGLSRHRMVGIYLNDHLAGATAGTELAHRMAQSHKDQQEGSDLMGLATEIGRDVDYRPVATDGAARAAALLADLL